jgi:hypothetical protein
MLSIAREVYMPDYVLKTKEVFAVSPEHIGDTISVQDIDPNAVVISAFVDDGQPRVGVAVNPSMSELQRFLSKLSGGSQVEITIRFAHSAPATSAAIEQYYSDVVTMLQKANITTNFEVDPYNDKNLRGGGISSFTVNPSNGAISVKRLHFTSMSF